MKRKAKMLFFVINATSVYILLGRRKVSNFEEFWWLPGGSANDGENDFGAACREIKEELELTPEMSGALDQLGMEETAPPSLKYLTLNAQYTIFFIKLFPDALVLCPKTIEEFEEMKWHDLDALPQNMSREWAYLKKNVTKEYLTKLA